VGSPTPEPEVSTSQSPEKVTAAEEEPASAPLEEDPFKGVPILHRDKGELYLFDVDVETFVLQEKVVTVDIAEGGPFDYWLIVRQDNIPFISVPLDAEMVPQLEPVNHAFMFTYKPMEGEGTTWCIRFDEAAFLKWKEAFTRYMWEGRNQMPWAKAKADEQKYINQAYEDVDMEDVSGQQEDEAEESDEEEASETSGAARQGGSDGFDEDESGEDEDKFDEHGKGGKNEQLTIGYKHDRSFVVRGDMIGVFKHTADNQVKFATSINRVADLKGKSFTPKKVGRVFCRASVVRLC
jgi:hypothetical protein